ncbi:SUMF1/EgtB/PvdO family nonheme iron enzyme [Pseudoalteromonas sp. ZZD1]|uniref:SUMF1/EgtB/PvdO family nonheme iron enzyme n=1 Tax=Pseudoalteromonas sp. ZZD1 TaxID=3139395 RepID=UPI003BABA142
MSEVFTVDDYTVGDEIRADNVNYILLESRPSGSKTEVWLVADKLEIMRSPLFNIHDIGTLQHEPAFHYMLKNYNINSVHYYENDKAALSRFVLNPARHVAKMVAPVDLGRAIGARPDPDTDEIVDVYLEGSRPFIVTQYIQGEALANYKEMGIEGVLTLLPQMGAMLNELLQAGIVHRDISINNLLLDTHNHLWLIDFATSKHSDTQHILGEGTPGFRAPEVSGKHQTVDDKADQFSMAAVIYYLLVGRSVEPEVIDADEVTTINKAAEAISQSLEIEGATSATTEVFLTALSPKAAQRYSTVDAFIDAMTQGLKAMAANKSEQGPLEEARKQLFRQQTTLKEKQQALSTLHDNIVEKSAVLHIFQQHGLLNSEHVSDLGDAHAFTPRYTRCHADLAKQNNDIADRLTQYDQAITALKHGQPYQQPESYTSQLTALTGLIDEGQILHVNLQKAQKSAQQGVNKHIETLGNSTHAALNSAIEKAQTQLSELSAFIETQSKQKHSHPGRAILAQATQYQYTLSNALAESKAKQNAPAQLISDLQLLASSTSNLTDDVDQLNTVIEQLNTQQQASEAHTKTQQQAAAALLNTLGEQQSHASYWQAALNNTKSYKKTKVTLGLLIVAGGLLWVSTLLPKSTPITVIPSSEGLYQGRKGTVVITHDAEYQDVAFTLTEANCYKNTDNSTPKRSVFSCQLNAAGEQTYTINHHGDVLKTAVLTVAKPINTFTHRVEPSDASIYIDGDYHPKHIGLQEGRYEFKVTRKGYHTLITTEEFTWANGVEFKLAPILYPVTLSITPSDAKVSIANDKTQLNYPIQQSLIPAVFTQTEAGFLANLPQGQYQLRITHPDFEPVSQSLNVTDRIAEQINLTKPLTRLTLNVTPSDARILVNNQAYTSGAPVKFSDGNAHNVAINITKAGYKSINDTITIQGAKTRSFTLSKEPKQTEANQAKSGQVKGNQLADKKVTLGSQQFTLKAIPAGSFMMGCSPSDAQCDGDEWLDKNKKTRLKVTLPAFYLMEHEVTWAMYQPCIDAGKCPNNDASGGDNGWGKGSRPVIEVSNNDIVNHYIPWLNKKTGQTFRLPSESEWEYAARAGSDTVYSWGDKLGSNNANCAGCGSQWDNKKTAPVMQFKPNAYGLYDMHGNVWEWTQDCWSNSLANTPSNGGAANKGNCSVSVSVLRGGAWDLNPRTLRASTRNWYIYPYRRDFSVGFRMALDAGVDSANSYSIYFDYDRATIKETYGKIFNNLASKLIENEQKRILIESYSSKEGTSAYNLALSEHRANAAKTYLLSLGVKESQINVRVFSELGGEESQARKAVLTLFEDK